MSSIHGGFSQHFRQVLTSLAEELYWSEKDYNDAAEQFREEAEDVGFEYVDAGDSRLVMQIPEDQLAEYDEPLVAKFPRRRSGIPSGIKQNIEEIDLYRNAPDWFQEYLIPIEAAHSNGFWLVMRYAPVPSEDAIEDRKQELIHHGIGTNEILIAQNWGCWRGNVYLIDYGFSISDLFPDIEIRDWANIVDEEDRRRGIIYDEASEETEHRIKKDSERMLNDEDETPDEPTADRVVALADIIPAEKPEVRKALINEVVQSGDEINVEIDGRQVAVEIERTEPRSNRCSHPQKLTISNNTRVSL